MVSAAAKRGEPRSRYVSLPYSEIERTLLAWLKEIRPADIAGEYEMKSNLSERVAATEGQLAEVERKILTIKKRLLKDASIETLVDLLADLDGERMKLAERLDSLRTELRESEDDDALADTKSIVATLDEASGEDRTKLRIRLKEQLRNLISEIWVMTTVEGQTRRVHLDIHFRSGTSRTIYVRLRKGKVADLYDVINWPGEIAGGLRETAGTDDLEEWVGEIEVETAA